VIEPAFVALFHLTNAW